MFQHNNDMKELFQINLDKNMYFHKVNVVPRAEYNHMLYNTDRSATV